MFFLEKFYSFLNYDMRGSKNRVKMPPTQPSYQNYLSDPPPWEKLLSPYICDVHFSENENFVQRRALN